MISARNKIFHIVLGLILSWGSSSLLMAAVPSDRPLEYRTVRYSTTVKQLLRQVVDKQAGLFNYQECSLIETNQEASYDGFEIESCKLLSNKWIIYDDPHVLKFNSVYARIFNEFLEIENISRSATADGVVGFTVAMAGLAAMGSTLTVLNSRMAILSNFKAKLIAAGSAFAAGLVVVKIGVDLISHSSPLYSLPSIESSLISQKEDIEMHLDGEELTEEKIQDYSETYYFLFQNSLYETLMQLGLHPSA